MILVVGGAYQGKLAYAQEKYPDISWADGRTCSEKDLQGCGGIHHFHAYVERLLKAGEQVRTLAGEIADTNPDIVIVCDELGCGIVPADAFEREYREKTGRVCTELAVYADKVYRVVCGIGQLIKG